jgi:hypothetical protein
MVHWRLSSLLSVKIYGWARGLGRTGNYSGAWESVVKVPGGAKPVTINCG